MTLLKDNLNTHFSKVFDGLIWKIVIDEKNDIAAIEIREPKTKSAQFSCIDLKSGNVLFDNLKLQEPWFCGMETISDGVLLLHLYVADTSPEHSAVLAYDARSGKQLWENYNLTFSQTQANSFKAFHTRIEPRKFISVDKFTGIEIAAAKTTNAETDFTTAIKVPQPVSPDQLPSTLKSGDFTDIIEGAAYADKKILSLYINENQLVTNKIFVFNNENELIFEDILRSDVQKQGFDTFFVYKNYLLYIKNRTEFVSYFL
ncbi:DUF4905 domain-containing protein [Solitalea sp. MAHUQ-68]|uniref:DUF4905 domain-containing protein n=1 Tax=Solitalea agri TaxID=2953739 RepID=A0A9X2F5P0_9SPHI|nr:DUF4905 domain-containing protein [Solitalea agri]MCO4294786.1 DUF4905 domain-containing protein [Solitalea agri]